MVCLVSGYCLMWCCFIFHKFYGSHLFMDIKATYLLLCFMYGLQCVYGYLAMFGGRKIVDMSL